MLFHMKYRVLICIITTAACSVIKLPAAQPQIDWNSIPKWDSDKLRFVLRPIDTIISTLTEGADKIAWEKLSQRLVSRFWEFYPDAPQAIRDVVYEIYHRAYTMLLSPKRKDRFELCLCHPLSFRTEMMLLFMRDCLARFPAKSKALHCAVIASGDLLQDYILFSIMQDVFGYKNLVLYLIDLVYEDPQFEAGKWRGVETLPKELQEQWKKKSFQAMMSEYHKDLVKHAVPDKDDQLISSLRLEAFRKVLNHKSFEVSIHHFRHVYGFIDWAKKENIKLHALIMIDPVAIDSAVDGPGSGAYPTLSNMLFLDGMSSQYAIFRHRTEHMPTVWYERLSASSQSSSAGILVNRMMQKAAKKMSEPVPWSLLFEEIEQYDPKQERVKVGLRNEPYTSFDDIAFSLLVPNGLAYQSSLEFPSTFNKEGAELMFASLSGPTLQLYIFDLAKEKERIKSGLPVKKMQGVLKRQGFQIIDIQQRAAFHELHASLELINVMRKL